MANPTNPFNWQMPQSTDLVTDLPADFETFGQAVATSMADLLGGTTGQVLSKASNTDMDFTWVTSDDANAIQNTIVDAKGDLIAASAADTPARLAVGANGQSLVADSTTATGLKWQGFAGVAVQNSVSQNLTNNTYTSMTANTEIYDTDGFHSTTTNTERLTVPAGKAGYYKIFAQVLTGGGGSTGVRVGRFLKNGSNILAQAQPPFETICETALIMTMVQYLSVGDYLELQVYQNSGITQPGYLTAANGWFGMELMGA